MGPLTLAEEPRPVVEAAIGALAHSALVGRRNLDGSGPLQVYGRLDGGYPLAGVSIGDTGVLYGTTSYGGSGACSERQDPPGCGAVYAVAPPAFRRRVDRNGDLQF